MNLKTFRYLLLLKTALFIGMQSAPAQSHSIPDSLNTIINSAASDSVKIEAYTQLFNFHYRKLKIKEASDVANKSLDFSLKCKNKKGIADSYNNLAITMSEMGKLAEAKKYFLLSLEMRRELNDKKFLAKTLGNLGSLHSKMGVYPESIQYFTESLKLREEIRDSSGWANTMYLLGVAYKNMGDVNSSLSYFKASLKIYEAKKDKKQLAVVLNGLGNSYLKSNDLDSALSCFTEACRINESLGEEVNVQFNKVNIAATQIELGRNKFKEGDSINGMKYALNAYATYKQITTDSNSFFNEYQMYDVSIIGADASMLVGKYDEGIGYATKAIENANKLETPEERMNAYEVLADIQQAKALTLNHAPDSMKDLLLLSFKNYKTSRELKDSLFNAENTTKIAEIRTKYESEKKDNEIVLLNKERELQEINLKEKQAIILLSRLQVAKNQDEIELLSKTRNLQELKLLTAEQELMVKEQTLKANAALLELEQKTKVIQQEQLSNEVLFRNMIIGSALILGLFGFLFFNRFKLQKQVEQHQKLIDQRKHIGADLHDDVGSTLSSISIYSEAIKTKLNLNESEKVMELVHKIGDNARETISNLSDIVWSINPVNDKGEVLFSRMESFASELLASKEIKLNFHCAPSLLKHEFGMDIKQNLYLIFKEAINNIAKHSGASIVNVSFENSNHLVKMKISDNGRGFDPSATNQKHGSIHGNGLKNMKDRAHALNGNLNFTSSSEGTFAFLEFPIS